MVSPPKPLAARKRPTQPRSAATVSAILEASARILERDGLAKLNTNAAAALAGVSIGSLYQYFPGKEALLAALIREKRSELLIALEQQTLQAPHCDLQTFLVACIRAAVAHQLARPRLATALEYAEMALPLDGETQLLKQQITNAIATVLQLHHIENPEIAARDLAAMVRGMADTAGLFSEINGPNLEQRIQRAVFGYLGLSNVGATTKAARTLQ